MRRNPLPLIPLLVLAGCGGGSRSSSPSSAASYQGGVASLGNALANSGDRSANLKSAQSSFDAAYAKTPNDPRVALGYGVSTAALAAARLADLFGTDVLSRGAAHPARAAASAARRLTLLAGLGVRLGAGGKASLAATMPALAIGVHPRIDVVAIVKIAADLRKVVDRLPDDRVAALEARPLVLDEGSISLRMGTVEGYALRSAVKAVLGVIDGVAAYDVDPGAYDPSVAFAARFAAQIESGSALAPADYLPSDGFGVARSNAAALLADLGVEWTGTADDGDLALAALAARKGEGWLTDLVPLTDADKADAKAQLGLLRAVVAGPTAVPFTAPDGTATSLTLDLAAVIANPPADLKAFFPSLRATSATTLQPVAGSVADPTYGGLVPGGVPAPILYGRTLAIDDATTQGDVALWAASPFAASAGG